ncbi:hypothetical protein PP634_gp42 [Arthrobacter phage Richie]|uniref:Uncharacterized protein n=1 Tax=Arthrobacter phage Richie TaxID=2419967 RepID=A0A3G2KIQ7_9CAUD|nr:hypothetical protein PP634_gp42 [Arthrobacter phage Richie]AYN58868.1 hypothetical protein PBI_RICHIE_42 [Arthrobacter phage Richie]
MASIIDFLEARIAEDEAQARAALATVAPDEWENPAELGNFYPEDIAFWNSQTPRRVLAECAAKRAIMAHHTTHTYTDEEPGFSMELWDCMCNRQTMKPCPTVAALAAVYKDHPDYQQEWA